LLTLALVVRLAAGVVNACVLTPQLQRHAIVRGRISTLRSIKIMAMAVYRALWP
jgi:hypothetical protein